MERIPDLRFALFIDNPNTLLGEPAEHQFNLLMRELIRRQQCVELIKRYFPGLRSSFAGALDGSGDEIIWMH